MATRDPFVPSDDLYDLNFDQFSRQYLVKRLVEGIRTKRKLKILDVGGNNGCTREFFPGDEVKVLDLYEVDEPWYIKASALDMPLADDSFDIVVTFDVYEHIPPKDRQKFVGELLRVAKTAVFIAAPFGTDFVSTSEADLNNFFKTVSGHDHKWLLEHIENSLPDSKELEQQLTNGRQDFEVYSSNNILLWMAMQSLIFIAHGVKAPERLSKLNQYFNQNLLEIGDNQQPSYRQLYAISKRGKLKFPAISRTVDTERLRQLINHMGQVVHELLHGSESTITQLAALERETKSLSHQVDSLTTQLDDILGSRSWRIATGLRRAKSALTPWRWKR